MKYLLLLVLPLLLTFSSCNNNKELDPKKKIQRRWLLNSDSQKEGFILLTFDKKTKSNTFSTNVDIFPDSIGTWQLNDDTLILSGLPIFNSKFIDSSVISKDSTNATITYYHDGRKLGVLTGNKIQPVRHKSTYIVKKNSDDAFVLTYKSKVYEFAYKPDEYVSDFSVMSVLRGILGIMTLLVIAWLFSSNRKNIDWKLILKGIILQIVIALLVLKVPFVASMFEWISDKFVKVINFTFQGTEFLFGSYETGKIEKPLITFVINVLPVIIFFSALTSLFYYWGILQKVVWLFAAMMKKLMKLSGSESMAAAGNIFLGQTEAPLLVKPYLMGMTKSEIMCLMTGGMASIAGGVLAAYIGMLGGGDPIQEIYFAKHLLTASIMSAPAAIVAAKILVPETEEYNDKLVVSKEKIGANELEAIANGTTDGIKLAVNVAGMLLVFIALLAFGNWILGGIGHYTGINTFIAEHTSYPSLSFDVILGYICAPIVWLMGIPANDMVLVGELLGKKTMINEFIAYERLGVIKDQLSDKSTMMATYMLCGFANFASIGIQIGGIGALIPSRKGMLSKLGFRALIGGTIACLMTAVLVGMMM